MWVALLLATVTFAVFSPCLQNGFVDWDDRPNFVDNHAYRGLGLTQLHWMLTTTHMGHWIPVTWLTFGLDYVIWGMDPLGYHLTNVAVHAVTVALVYLMVLRLLSTLPWTVGTRHVAATAGALFFGLHPLRAESVAWITERRDALSTALFLVSLLLYLQADHVPHTRRRSLVFSLVAFGLAIASKAMVMTLPAVLLILDVYPLRRIRLTADWRANRAPLVEKIPYVVLGGIAAALGVYGQMSNDFFTPLAHYSWSARLTLAVHSVWFYLWKTAMPIGLSPLYELPASVRPLDVRFIVAGLAVISITTLVIAVRRRLPVLAAAFASYVIMVAPVSGIAHAGFQLAHDRYSYLPSLGIAVVVGVAVGTLVHHRARFRTTLVSVSVVAVAGLLTVLGGLTWQQVQIWRDTGTLWAYAVDAEPSCSVCRGNLGMWLAMHGHPAAGVAQLESALALRPDRTELHQAFGIALVNVDRVAEGLQHLETRRAAAPNDVETLVGIAVAQLRAQRPAYAEAPITRAIAVNPMYALARVSYGDVLRELNRPDRALAEYQRALALDRASGPAHFAYGRTLAKYGYRTAARDELRALWLLDPKLAAHLASEVTPRRRTTP